MTIARHAHCSFCGAPFAAWAAWPRTCESCQNTSYINPLPVAVALIPVGEGLLGVRRGIEPRKGLVALPGGFIEVGESWQQACAREAFEEIQVQIDPETITLHTVLSAPDGTVLIMGLTPPIDEGDLPEFVSSPEAIERTVFLDSEELKLAFPLHTDAAKLYFARQRPSSD